MEYKLELTAGNWESWTRLTIPELGLIIEWVGDEGAQYANIYIDKEQKDEIRGYCGSTDNNVAHNLDLPLTRAVYGEILKVSSPQCDGKDADDFNYIVFHERESESFSFDNYETEYYYEDFKYCEGSPQYRRRRSTDDDEDDSCNGDDPVEICSGILETLSDCKKSMSNNELNAFLKNCQFDMCLDDRNGNAFLL